MPLINFLILLIGLFVFNATVYAQAEQRELKPFVSGSYQQLLSTNKNSPFMLVVWSITCSSCLKDMALLSSIHKNRPKLKIVMLSTDDISSTPKIIQILEKNELTKIENWIYAEDNTQKLQYEIDSSWYGELPRTYFFDKSHDRVGISGVLTQADYDSHFASMSD